MTPEDRAKSVLHFLDEYLIAREEAMLPTARILDQRAAESARQFLGTALVALVTGAPEPKQMHWRPVETAPKDGTWIMLNYRSTCVPIITFWSDTTEDWAHRDQLGTNKPTHWMPVPEAPK